MKLLISACLLGCPCRYDGKGKEVPGVHALSDSFALVPVCPEQLGGLPTPRPPCEITGGRVLDVDGRDKTRAFQQGAEETLRICQREGCGAALLKARSPSCGRDWVYDGSFSGALVRGHGITARLLMDQGIQVYTEDEITQLQEGGALTQAEGGKLWGGRFQGKTDETMERFHNIAGDTAWLLEADILGSIAHAKMLVKCGLITREQGQSIDEGLNTLLKQLRGGELHPDNSYEDVHSFVELRLTEMIGDAGKLLHTARSRNDQVNLDMKLFARERCGDLLEGLKGLTAAIKALADQNSHLMPGYTHMQRAQAVTFKHFMMAYHDMFVRDIRRMDEAIRGMDESPLGCGALAGTTHDIDRAYTAELLGFSRPYANFLDGVSDRDYLLESLSVMAIIMMHLSRLSEELITFSTNEFGFVTLSDRFATGSSIMPQKKNPDSLELIRGKAGSVYGSLIALLTVMKGLPLSYNKDMQEDKQAYYSAVIDTEHCLAVMTGVIQSLTVHKDRMREALKGGFMNATEAADYLVRKGMPFRDAHGVIGRLVLLAESKGKALEELSLEDFRSVSQLFEDDIFSAIDYEQSIRMGIKKEML